MNKYTNRIGKMKDDRNMTVYRLSEESGVAQNTIKYWFNSDTYPLVPQIEKICEAFGITIGQFFCEGNYVELTSELKEFCDDLLTLTPESKATVKTVMKSLKAKK